MYYLILALPFILYFSRLFLTNYAIPGFKKKHIRKDIAKREDADIIFTAERFINDLFKKNYAKITSRIYRWLQYSNNREFIYGEIDVLGFHNIIEKASPKKEEVFYDLGSGAGKAVFCAALYFDFKKCCGIELVDALYKKSLTRLSKTKFLLQQERFSKEGYLSKLSTIRFIKNDFLTYDFSNADIIYLAATCLSDETLSALISSIGKTKIGTRVIIATKKINNEAFELIYDGVELMGWGLCQVRIYRHVGLASRSTKTIKSCCITEIANPK